jgi:hypothetical protein
MQFRRVTNDSIATIPALRRFTVEEIDEELSGMSGVIIRS